MQHFKTEIKPIKGTNKYKCSCYYEENGIEYKVVIYMQVFKNDSFRIRNDFSFTSFMPQRNIAICKLICDAQLYFYENLEGVTK